MDLRSYYKKVRETEAALKGDHFVLVSLETPEGGKRETPAGAGANRYCRVSEVPCLIDACSARTRVAQASACVPDFGRRNSQAEACATMIRLNRFY